MGRIRAAVQRSTRTHTDEAGQGLAEYALIVAFIALVCVGALGVLGNAIADSGGFKLFS